MTGQAIVLNALCAVVRTLPDYLVLAGKHFLEMLDDCLRNQLDAMDETRRTLLASFLSMETPNLIVKLARYAGNGSISYDVQHFFYNSCLNNLIVKKFPPSRMYLRSVLKQLILAAESEGEEVLGDLYEQQITLLKSPKELEIFGEPTRRCFRSYLYSVSDDTISNIADCIGMVHASKFRNLIITIRVSVNMLEGSTGCYAWPAGLFLSELLISYPGIFSGRCCLEIGAGAGVSSICLAHLNASKVIVTDGNLSTVANLRQNLLINDLRVFGETVSPREQHLRKASTTLVECHELLWESATEQTIANFGADILIGADLIYDPTCIPHLVRVLRLFLSRHEVVKARPGEGFSQDQSSAQNQHPDKLDSCIKDGMPIAFLATAIRNMETLNMFISSAHLAGLLVEDVTHTMKPSVFLPHVTEIDRSAICLHKVGIR